MPRRVKNTSKVRGAKTLSQTIEVRDDTNAVIGRANVIVERDGDVWVEFKQTYGGKAEGTLAVPVRCDLDVLKQVVEEAEAIALALA